MRKAILTSIVVSVAAFNAQSQMTVNVWGVPGSGTTTWTFRGSASLIFNINGANDHFSISNPNFQKRQVSVNLFAHSTSQLSGDIGSIGNVGNQELPMVSGDLTVTGSLSGAHNVDGIGLDSDNDGVGDDDFMWFADGAFHDTTSDTQREDFTYSGHGIFNVDITSFGIGPTAISTIGDSFSVSSTSEMTGLTMTFAAVPEPGEYAVVAGLLALGFGVYRKRLARSARA